MGASSRAAGIVRAQGGTPATVALGRWSIDFYSGQQAAYGTDSGFRELGYLILAVTEEDERAGRERVAMQHANGLDECAGSMPPRRRASPSTLAPRQAIAAARYIGTDGAIDPPRNVRAYGWRCRRPASTCASGRRVHGSAHGARPTGDSGSRASRRRPAPSRPSASC